MTDQDQEAYKRLEKRINELEQDRKNFFKTGIMILGALVLGLIGYIWRTSVG